MAKTTLAVSARKVEITSQGHYGVTVELDEVDTDDILSEIGGDQVKSWLEREGYRVEEED